MWKLTGKEKHSPYTAISLNKVNQKLLPIKNEQFGTIKKTKKSKTKQTNKQKKKQNKKQKKKHELNY